MIGHLEQPYFGKWVYQTRLALGLSQAELAKLLGIDPKTVQRWERGSQLPRPYQLSKLREVLGFLPVDAPERETSSSLAISRASEHVAHQNTSRPFMVEDLPTHFVQRHTELDALITALLDDKSQESVAITAALQGTGGYGKTTMAQAVCSRLEIRNAFDNGILWVTLGEHPRNIVGKIEDLIFALSGKHHHFSDIEPASAYFRALVADYRILLVIDDVWNPAHLKPFLPGGKRCRCLITTRDESVLPRKTQCIQVNAMNKEEAFHLLNSELHDTPHSLKDTQNLRTLVHNLGEWPLLLTLANGALRECVHIYGQNLSDAISYINKALERFGMTAFDHTNAQKRDQAVRATLQASFQLLNADDYASYKKLAIFPAEIPIPLQTLQRLWNTTEESRFDDLQTEVFCRRLRRLSLLLDLDPVTRMIRLHDVIRDYLCKDMGIDVLTSLHQQLLDAYHIQHWAELPDNEPYLWDHLAEHLIAADRNEELMKTALDLYYLAKKTFVRNTYATLLDVLAAEIRSPDTTSLRLVKHTITNMSHLLNICHTVDEVAVTLYSRLIHLDEITELCQILRQKLSYPFFMPWHTLPSLPDPSLIRTLQENKHSVEKCTISPDSSWIVSASDDHTLKVWDAQTGTKLFTLEGHEGYVYGCAISPLGDYIVSASADKTLKVWDAQIGTELLTLRGHTETVYGCAISPSGEWIVSASQDKTLKIWDTQTGTERFTLYGHTAIVRGCAISPSGEWIVSASWDGTLKVWDSQMGAERMTLKGHGGSVYGCAISPSGEWIVSTSWDGTLKVWDSQTGAERMTLKGHSAIVLDCSISSTGAYIVSVSQDETLKVWDAQTGTERFNLQGPTSTINTCAISPKENYIVTGEQSGQVKMWDLHAESKHLVEYWQKVNGCAVSPDGKWVVSAQEDEVLTIWDTQTVIKLLTLEGHAGPVYGCAISPQGDWIVSASDDNTLSVWDAYTGKELARLQGHTERVYNCAISPSEEWIVSASDDKTLIVWQKETGYDYLTLSGHENVVNDCAIRPQGDWVVSASADKTLKIWDLQTGRELQTLTGHAGWVLSCKISPRGDWVVSASADKTLKIWDLQTGEEKKTLRGHTDTVSACAISPDGTHIVSVSYDGSVKAWNASSGKCLATFLTEGKLRTCVFCPDGQHIIAGGYSGLYFLQLVTQS